MTTRIVLALALVPLAACKCGNQLNGAVEGLLVPDWDAGSTGVGNTVTGQVLMTDNGSAITTLYSAKASSAQFAASVGDAGYVAPGDTQPLFLSFTPSAPGPQKATVTISSDNGDLTINVYGVGIDECASLGCGADAGSADCAGTCVSGKCQFPSGNSCTNYPACLSAGQCNGNGRCEGSDYCVPSGSCSSDGVTYKGQGATLPDGHGTCNPGLDGLDAGTCLFTTGSQETCDCGCISLADGGGQCAYSWAPDPTAPTASFGSVWASTSGDVWASASSGTNSNNFDTQTFYELTSSGWVQQGGTISGANPLCGAGSGCSAALTGDGNGNVWAADQCVLMGQGDCADAGMWKWSSGAQSFEAFDPGRFTNGSGDIVDRAFAYPVMLGSTPGVLNSNPAGTELMTEQNGTFAVVPGTQLPAHCSATGALWGTSSSDFYVAWGCGNSGPGNIWKYSGSSYASQLTFTGSDYASAMAGTSDSDVWAVGTQRWHYDGTTWTVSTPPPDLSGNQTTDSSLWSAANGEYYASGSYPGVYHYASGAWNLECFAPGFQGNDQSAGQVAGDANGNFYAATPTGIFKRQ